MRSDYKAAPNQQQLPLSFYLTFGYFPRSMDEALDFYHRKYSNTILAKNPNPYKQIVGNLVNESGNMSRRGVVLRP